MTRALRPRRTLLTAAAVAVIIVAGATPALAQNWTVTPGGAVTSTDILKLKDTTTATTINCPSSGLAATLNSTVASNVLGTITLTFNNCAGPPGITYTVTTNAPWTLNALTYNISLGVTHGTITGVHLALSGSGCQFVVDGTSGTADDGVVSFKHTNNTHKITLLPTGGNLHFYNVTGCFGLFSNGDSARLTGVFALSPVQNIHN